jgi:hypothetical protein
MALTKYLIYSTIAESFLMGATPGILRSNGIIVGAIQSFITAFSAASIMLVWNYRKWIAANVYLFSSLFLIAPSICLGTSSIQFGIELFSKSGSNMYATAWFLISLVNIRTLVVNAKMLLDIAGEDDSDEDSD